MSEQDTENVAPEVDATPTDSDDPEGAAALGDAGKKALDAMKAKWKAEKARAEELARHAADLEAKQSKSAEEYEAFKAEREAQQKAESMFRARLAEAELRAAAKGVLTDPSDALTFIKADSIEVGDDGTVDRDAIEAALTSLVESKPYLAERNARRFEGSADGGAREASGPKQWTKADLHGKTPQQIEAAREAGLLADVLSGKS